MNLMQHAGLELPIYTESEVAWTEQDIKTIARFGGPNFVRRTRIDYRGPDRSLHSVLALADRVLDTVREKMGVEVVEHSWGLAPVSQRTRDLSGDNYRNDYDGLPEGYGLVARVENVIGARALTDFWKDSIKKGRPWKIGVTTNDGHSVTNYDLSEEQFVLRRERRDDPVGGRAVLVDIEPTLHSKAWE